MEKIELCTAFDRNYVVFGIAMMESAMINSSSSIYWTVLTLDLETNLILKNLNIPNLKILEEKDIHTIDLNKLKKIRNYTEYCWSLAAILLDYKIKTSEFNSIIGYVDADVYFYEDIMNSLTVLNKGDIAIHEHRFSDNLEMSQKKVGIFNVGLIAGNYSEDFSSCIENWRDQVINECVYDPENDKCGDQQYLNEWPDKYISLQVMKGHGDGAGVWNLKNTQCSQDFGKIQLGSDPLNFFHFHGLKIYIMSRFLVLYSPSPGYGIKKNYFPIYERYLVKLRDIELRFQEIKVPRSDRNWMQIIQYFFRGEIGIFH